MQLQSRAIAPDPLKAMTDLRHLIFQTAHAYFEAAARYWTAARRGEDMETPTQELVGRGIFYHQALVEYVQAVPDARFARRRLAYLREHARLTSRLYPRMARPG